MYSIFIYKSAVNNLLSVTGWVLYTTIVLQWVAVFHKCTPIFWHSVWYSYKRKMNIIMFAVLFLYGFYGIELAVKILNLSLAEFYIHVQQIVLTSSPVLRHLLERTCCLSSHRYFTKKYLSGVIIPLMALSNKTQHKVHRLKHKRL